MKMMRRRILLILLVACGIAGGEEATYYLDADEGNDTTGDGSSGNPWATLTKAQATVVSGDTVKLYGGNYGAFAQTNPSYSSYVTYEAVDGDGDPPIFTSATVNRTTTLADVYLRFRDIWFDNGGLIVYRTRYLEVVDCNFVGAGYTLSDIPAASATNYAIRLENDCTLCTIQDCTITGDGAGQTRLIGGYSAGRVATVYPDWTTSPDATSIYQILPAARVDIQGWAGNLVTGDGDWAALALAAAGLDAAGVRAALGMASADLDTQLDTILAAAPSDPVLTTTVATGTHTASSFTLTAGVAVADAYRNHTVRLTDATDSHDEIRRIASWTAGRIVQVDRPFSFTPADGDVATIESYVSPGQSKWGN